MSKKIIDISSYQSNIDWSKVTAEGVIIKVGEANFADSSLVTHSNNASANDKHLSYYYFAHPNKNPDVTTDAEASADFFYNLIKDLEAPSFDCALDIEINPNSLTPSEMEEWITAFIANMGTYGISMMIYGGPYFLDNNLPDGHSLGTIGLWLSEYENTYAPTVYPKGWNTCTLWQHTANAIDGGLTVDESMAADDFC
jgi:GH25 family lysozyme M1 (1,4-beta-N-acetylmuramidase)